MGIVKGQITAEMPIVLPKQRLSSPLYLNLVIARPLWQGRLDACRSYRALPNRGRALRQCPHGRLPDRGHILKDRQEHA